jgi:glucose-1-phosphate adenylyltransferase
VTRLLPGLDGQLSVQHTCPHRRAGKNARDATSHDFGHDIIPQLIGDRPVYAYDFRCNRLAGEAEDQPIYWRDVGTLDAYYEANMDLRDIRPMLNLYNLTRPIRTATSFLPPAKFAFDEEGRRGLAIQSIVSEGSILSGATVVNSVLGRGVFGHSYSVVEWSIINDHCHIHRHAQVRRAIIDKDVHVPEGERIGFDLDYDRQRFHVTDGGLVVVPKGYIFAR